METYIKLKTKTLKSKGLDIYEKVIISYIISFIENNKKFYSTNEQISEELEIPVSTVKKKIKSLIEKGFINSNVHKKGNTETWLNQRIITLVPKQSSTSDVSQNIQSNDVKSVEIIDNTSNIEKVQQSEEKQDDIEIPTTIFKQNKVEIKKIELNKDLLSTLLDEPEPDLEFLN
jgi:DNA-binding MarR family transcriptional regulator